ncbi:MAG TPA: secretin N-terminal domain-containing protein [Thermoanaerobaculia bacterium]|nr:secretin N-terminal domain-containing protein [Thermoanaerobaculia bacterium]
MIAILLVLMTCGAALAEPAADGKALTVRTYQFKYKDADKAAAVIKSLMSTEGSLSIQPAANSLVVTDHPDNLKQISAALLNFDAPAQAFKLSVRLISAAKTEGSPRVPDELRDVAPKLAMLRYNSFEDLGSIEVEGHEGEPGLVDMQSGYRADFRIGEYDPASDSIKVNDFRLSKLQGAHKDELAQLLKTSLNLKLGQTVILGASKASGSQRALMLVVVARR